ncbi:hypothetical protein [Nannocystis punicea]|uniref:Uncharacterized protein n=1 Tax=Nannocystis punicea TaxID=2995304 RepID=A0ABY7H940_9BACT|nr:hypothetical protein [Nannocystis poenicansa]WAS95796.1 hypothetical protein O0S08_06500 [Nannocystis poenicansa]
MSDRAGEAVLTRDERFVVFLLWLGFAWIPSLTLWALTGYFGTFYSPLLWVVTLGASTPAMSRVLGQVEPVEALPPAEPASPHLPPALARLVEEAAAIRDELAAGELETALERAWILSNELEQLPHAGIALERSRAALAAVHELLELRARPGRTRVSRDRVRARLDTALAQFIASLVEQTRIGFR